MTRVILLNGPRGSGKDTAAELIQRMGPFPTEHHKFADPLRWATPGLFGISIQRWEEFYMLPEIKTKRFDILRGMSPAEAQIMVSEEFMKPKFGEGVFGELFVDRVMLSSHPPEIVVVSDSGFREESYWVTGNFEDVLLVRLHREGCTFEGDSRSYIYNIGAKEEHDITNNGTIDDLRAKLAKLL
jgi:hypothetical protein